jgi:hypothetical protein
MEHFINSEHRFAMMLVDVNHGEKTFRPKRPLDMPTMAELVAAHKPGIMQDNGVSMHRQFIADRATIMQDAANQNQAILNQSAIEFEGYPYCWHVVLELQETAASWQALILFDAQGALLKLAPSIEVQVVRPTAAERKIKANEYITN